MNLMNIFLSVAANSYSLLGLRASTKECYRHESKTREVTCILSRLGRQADKVSL